MEGCTSQLVGSKLHQIEFLALKTMVVFVFVFFSFAISTEADVKVNCTKQNSKFRKIHIQKGFVDTAG